MPPACVCVSVSVRAHAHLSYCAFSFLFFFSLSFSRSYCSSFAFDFHWSAASLCFLCVCVCLRTYGPAGCVGGRWWAPHSFEPFPILRYSFDYVLLLSLHFFDSLLPFLLRASAYSRRLPSHFGSPFIQARVFSACFPLPLFAPFFDFFCAFPPVRVCCCCCCCGVTCLFPSLPFLAFA